MKQHKRQIPSISSILLGIFLAIICLSACSTSNTFEDYVISGNYADAIMLYEKSISGNSIKESDAKNFLLKYMQSALSNYASGSMDLQLTESTFDCLMKIDDELCILNTELGSALEQFTLLQMSKENFKAGFAALLDENFEAAAALLVSVDESDTENYEASLSQLNFCYEAIYANANTEIDQHISEEDYESALFSFSQFFETYAELVTSDMKEKAENCIEAYRDQVIAKSIDLYHSNGAASAEAAINKGVQILNNDQQLINVSNLYLSAAEPVPISQLTGRKDGSVTLHGSNRTDSLGNNHSGGDLIYFFNLSKSSPTLGIERNTYGNYTMLTGDMFFLDTDYDMSASMKIYADGEIAFDSGSLDKKTGGTHFDVNISDVYSIKIELSFVDIGQTYSQCFLDNVFVSRQLTDEEIYQAATGNV